MWEYIRSCGKIDVLLQRVAVLLDEVAQHKATIDTLQRQLAATQQAERERVRAATTVIAPPTPGLSTPAVHAVEAYPTPRSEGNEDSPLLLSPLCVPCSSPLHITLLISGRARLPLVQRNRAPLTPVSNLRSAALRRRVFYAGAPLSPSPLARRVPIHADASIEADEDADESMVMGKLEVSDLQDAEDSMVLDGAPEVAGEDAEYDDEDEDPEDEEFEDMGLDEDLEPIGAFDGAPSPKRISDGTGVFMRMSDVFGNFVGEIFTTGRPRGSRERPTIEQKAQPLDAILPELSSHVPERADEAVDTGVGPSTSDIAVSTETSSYRSRAVSPVASSPDPRDAEIEELRGQVAHLKGDLECVRSTLGRRNECIEELEKQLANKQRRLQLLMSLHAQMDKEVHRLLSFAVGVVMLNGRGSSRWKWQGSDH